MNNKYEPCSICEDYMEGVVCEKDECPVAKMKAEVDRLQEHNNILICRIDDLVYECDCAKQEAIKEFFDKRNGGEQK